VVAAACAVGFVWREQQATAPMVPLELLRRPAFAGPNVAAGAMNLVANGFLSEFKLAVANLAANNKSGAANRIGSFAYFGPDTGTNPLPIFLAYLNKSTDYNNPAAYTSASTTWANSRSRARM